MRALSLLVLLAILALAAPSLAGPSPKEKEAKAAAKKHFEKAETHFQLREYELAIAELKESYRLYPNPSLLFNLGQCYREVKDYDSALSYYETYLSEAPKAKNRAEVEGLIEEVRGAKAEAERLRLEEEAKLKAMAAPTEKLTPKQVMQKWWFWPAIGGVAASAGLAITLGNLPPRTDLGNENILDK